jgi:hypothetical protein
MFAMTQIADGIGRLVCSAARMIVPQCQTGETVADVGYGVVLLILLSWGIYVLVNRATG